MGSIPFGLLLARMGGLGDIRAIGSGNIGATNVLRSGRKGLAAATMLADIAKGAAVVLMAQSFGPDMAVVGAAGALIGHVFPIWLKFRGGKGVATSLGVMLVLSWPVAVVAVILWIAGIYATRYSSLGALLATGSTPFLAHFFATPQIREFAIFLAVLVWLRHLGNIRRLLRGEETKVGKKT